MSHYIHHVTGRLRVKTPLLKRNEPRAAAVKELLAREDGVLSSDVNLVTGSIVITYDHALITPERIVDALKANGFVSETAEIGAVREPAPQAAKVARDVSENLGKVVFGFVVEKMVERSAVALIGALL